MSNFVIDTNDFLYDDNKVYCNSCESCGDFGCECWGNCIALRCKYGDSLIDAYEDNKKCCSLFYDMLVELGIENPYAIDLERIKEIANKTYPFIDGNLRSGIKFYYNELKDEEEEL